MFLWMLSGVLLAVQSPASSQALNIVLNYQANPEENDELAPTYDQNGEDLLELAEAAARDWEAIILDPGTVNIDVYWSDLNGALGNAGALTVVNGKPTTGVLRIDSKEGPNDKMWFLDQTPDLDEEFDMRSTIYRELSPADQAADFNGSPPGVLEVRSQGNSFVNQPINVRFRNDLLSVIRHELGHVPGSQLHDGPKRDPSYVESGELGL